MSWFKIPDNLAKLKDEVTNFATEVLAPDIADEDGTGSSGSAATVKKVLEAEQKVQELTNMCATQDTEITTLRKQVAELQQQQQIKSIETSISGLSKPNTISGSNANLEDSWFWEENSSTSSSKKGDTGSPSDLTNIPLDDVKDHKKIALENALMNEKLVQLNRENKELTANIDELDRQHSAAIEEVLKVKNLHVEKYNELQKEFEQATARHKEVIKQKELEIIELQTVEEKDESTLKSDLAASYDRIKNLQEEIMAICIEHNTLKGEYENTCKEKEELFRELCERKRILDEFTERFETDMTDLKDKVRYMEDLEAENSHLKTELANKTNFDEIKKMVKQYFNFESNSNDKDYFDEFLESTKDVTLKLKSAEKRVIDANHELEILKEAYTSLETEKELLKADLLNYEVECSELVKNNDNLVMEMEMLKTTKLETIPEQNEDIEILEQQLEDCSNMKQNLEDDYNEIRHKLDEHEAEKVNFHQRLNSLAVKVRDAEARSHDLELYIEGLENEKSNLLFEINELKASGESAGTSSVDANERVQDLEDQLHIANRDNQELQRKLNATQMQLLDSGSMIASLQSEVEEKKVMAKSHEKEIEKLREHVRTLQHDLKATMDDFLDQRERLQAEVERIRDDDDDDAKNANEPAIDTQEAVTVLEQQLMEKRTLVEQLTTENANLKIAVEEITKQKDGIIADMQKKTSELTQKNSHLSAYVSNGDSQVASLRAELESLTRLLKAEAEKSTTFAHRVDELEREQNVRSTQEMEKINDQMHFLREKADILTANLMTEQNNLKVIQKEKSDLVEKNNSLLKDLERLRQHLLEVEEAHTQETMDLQKHVDDSKARLSFMEDQVKQSSTAYTSANIRANQQVETLQMQYSLIIQQRDELVAKLSAAEDREQKQQAALTNLQCVLEQFQKDKNSDIEESTYTIRKEIESGQRREAQLTNEIQSLQQQLQEAQNGLLAATRLSDQLESSQMTVAQLKLELAKSIERQQSVERKMMDSEKNQADKVEKMLVKNMLIGYVMAPNAGDKQQILKLMSAVLDLNQEELAKVGLVKQSGWLSGILGGGTQTYNKDSLAQAFVHFLEKESQPKPDGADLLTIHKEEVPQQSPQLVEIVKEKPTVAVQPICLNEGILQQAFVPQRNSSAILKDILSDS